MIATPMAIASGGLNMVRNSSNLNANVWSVDDEELHRILDRGFDNPVSDDFHQFVRGLLCTVSSRFGGDGI
jgi:hypothetical protein